MERQLKGIVGLRFSIEALEGKLKLSQNRSEADRAAVAAALSASFDPQARDVGAMMQNHDASGRDASR
jgi:transcriptional regulator